MLLSPEQVDLQQIQRWRRICKNTHGDCCNNRHTDLLSQQLDTFNLVDVEAGCLVTLPSSTPFIAISYVWGYVPILKTNRSNMEMLRQPGFLSGPDSGGLIPDTIRDAIHLVKELGERYSWIDCLCIVQDDEQEVDRMLKAMARIYASAELTIIDAGGADAGHGLPGIGGPSRPRDREDFPDPENREGFPWNSKWASRGWTFQEALFSRRLLVFQGYISWICGRYEKLEEEDDSLTINENEKREWPIERPHLGVPMGMMSLLPDHPSLGRWAMLVENYAQRELTLERDITKAFAGATEVMKATFPGGLFHGLPEFFFDIALLWQPTLSIHRRNKDMPSWSWTGWKGAVECLSSWFPFYAGVYRHMGHSSEWVTIAPLRPTAEFKKMTLEFDTVPIENKFYDYQRFRKDLDAALPPGWRRQHHPEGDYFNNPTYPEFPYGMPLPMVDSFSVSSSNNEYSHILSIEAPMTSLRFGQFHNEPEKPLVAELLTSNGISVGSIILHHRDMPGATVGAPCELLAISKAEVPDSDRLDMELYRDEPLEWDVHRWEREMGWNGAEEMGFYNVLWIGWDKDIAYRKGLGKVGKRAWESLAAERMTVKLG